jgi:two-component system cell cycle response regulator
VPQRVLIIEDTRPIQALLQTRLKDEPIELMVADSSREGLKLAAEAPPDLILLDQSLPGEDALEVCRQIKADPTLINAPIILMVGVASPAQKIRFLDLGVTDYIAKPFDPADLIARVRAGLRMKYLLDLLASKAMVDGLTGAWNRQYFNTRLANEMAMVQRHGNALSLLRVDIDHLQSVNDRFGHLTGDQVLKRVANLLISNARGEDIVCRLESDDFALLTPNTSADRAMKLAERVHRAQEVAVTCSIGLADVELSESSPTRRAEEALAEAKKQGGNRVVLSGADGMSGTDPATVAA